MDLKEETKHLWKEVCQEIESKRLVEFESLMGEDVDNVIDTSEPRRFYVHRKTIEEEGLAKSFRQQDVSYCRVIDLDSGKPKVANVFLMESECEALPSHSTYLPLDELYSVPDNVNLTYVPACIDSMSLSENDEIFALYDTTERERDVAYGSSIHRKRINERLDMFLSRLATKRSHYEAMDEEPVDDNDYLLYLAKITDSDWEHFIERLNIAVFNENKQGEEASPEISRRQSISEFSEASSIASVADAADVIPEEDKDWAESDSYRFLFCNRCFLFDCNQHGLAEQPPLALHYRRANALDEERVRIESGPVRTAGEPFLENLPRNTLTTQDEPLCRHLLRIFDGDSTAVAEILLATVTSVQRLATDVPKLTRLSLEPLESKSSSTYYSAAQYKKICYDNIKTAEIHPSFEPCIHKGPCRAKRCRCIDNAFFCTSACILGPRSRNFFRGCSCRGKCRPSVCICRLSNRECDPDLCRCDACTVVPGRRFSDNEQQCRNDNMTMRRHAHLLINISTVPGAGWGCFTKYALAKGHFVHEYIGEVISQEEAERRGQLYDKQNLSYLFNLSSDRCVDANRRGNVTRFINHSSTPNCEVRTLFVNGDHRLGFFTTTDVAAESELFFDYRYSQEMDNDYIKKAAKEFDWLTTETESRRGATKPRAKASQRKKRKR